MAEHRFHMCNGIAPWYSLAAALQGRDQCFDIAKGHASIGNDMHLTGNHQRASNAGSIQSDGLLDCACGRIASVPDCGLRDEIHTATGSRWAQYTDALPCTRANACFLCAKTLSCGWSSGLGGGEEIMRKRGELVVMQSLHQGTAKQIADLFLEM